MEWADRLLTREQEGELLGHGGSGEFSRFVEAFYAAQKRDWPGLRAGIEARVETRRIETARGQVALQHNPQRIVSTGANVDPASIAKRPCFLCPDNMPAEEKALSYLGRYALLCNPFPILPAHLVIASFAHEAQSIAGRLIDMLSLAADLGDEFAVIYNGPECGASAPDHMHFQAGKGARLPLLAEADHWPRRELAIEKGLGVFALLDYRVNLLLADGQDRESLAEWFEGMMLALGEITGTGDREPLINLLTKFDGQRWRLFVFVRERHRPRRFFAEGGERLNVSPAAIDMAGLLVTPAGDDFHRLTAAEVSEVFGEVTLDGEKFARLCERLGARGSR